MNAAAKLSDLFHNTFVPKVQKGLAYLGVEPKADFILDNCSAHPDEEYLFSKDRIAKYSCKVY